MDETIQGMETQWFLTSKEIQDTEIIEQVAGVCLPGQRWKFGVTIMAEWNLVSSRQCCSSQGH
jgi:hypothetical protein